MPECAMSGISKTGFRLFLSLMQLNQYIVSVLPASRRQKANKNQPDLCDPSVTEPREPLPSAFIMRFKPTLGVLLKWVFVCVVSVSVSADYPSSGVKSAHALRGIRLCLSKRILLAQKKDHHQFPAAPVTVVQRVNVFWV